MGGVGVGVGGVVRCAMPRLCRLTGSSSMGIPASTACPKSPEPILAHMDLQQKLSEPSSTVFPIPKAGFTPISKYLSPRLGTFFTGLNRRARRAISRLLLLTFRDRNKPTWTNEVRGRVGDEDFILLVNDISGLTRCRA